MSNPILDAFVSAVFAPTVVSAGVMPAALLLIVLTAAKRKERLIAESSALVWIGIAWVAVVNIQLVLHGAFKPHVPDAQILHQQAYDSGLLLPIMALSGTLHVYVILGLIALAGRLYGVRYPPLIESRAFPVLTLSLTITLLAAAWYRQMPWFATPMFSSDSLVAAAALCVILVFIPEQQMPSAASTVAPNADHSPAHDARHRSSARSTLLADPNDSNPVPLCNPLSTSAMPQSEPTIMSPNERAVAASLEEDLRKLASSAFTQSPLTPAPQPSVAPTATAVIQPSPVSRTGRMHLKLRRSQRSSTFGGKVIFTLDARMEVPAQEAQLVAKYRLDDLVIYDSADREKYGQSMQAHLESTRDQPGFREGASSQLLGVGKTFYRLARAGASAAMASLKLRVTVAGLMTGVHVECKSMDELLGAEKAIVEAAENLRAYLDTAETFDGRETILEF